MLLEVIQELAVRVSEGPPSIATASRLTWKSSSPPMSLKYNPEFWKGDSFRVLSVSRLIMNTAGRWLEGLSLLILKVNKIDC